MPRLANLWSSLRGLFPETPAATSELPERRGDPRLPCDGVVASCQFARMRLVLPGWSAEVRNLSTGGVGLRQSRALNAGVLVTVELARPEKSFLRRIPARVVHAACRGEDWEIGCAFLRRLTHEEVELLSA